MNFYAMQENSGVAWSAILGQGNFHRASRFGRVLWAEKGWTAPAPVASGKPGDAPKQGKGGASEKPKGATVENKPATSGKVPLTRPAPSGNLKVSPAAAKAVKEPKVKEPKKE
jgi:hypothetical protein